MRALMTADTVGGVWTYSLELADALAEHGVEVTLAAMGAPLAASQRAELRRSRVAGAYAADYALEWMPDPWRDVERAGEWLLGIAGDIGPDLVQLNGYAHASLPWGAPVVVVGHSCVLSWFEAVRGHPAPPEWDRYSQAVREGLAAADLLVAPTAAMLAALRRLYSPSCPSLVIPNGLRVGRATAAKEELILSAGRLWDEAKNVGALAAVAPALDWPVAVAGPGFTDRRVRSLGVLARDELGRWLGRASIFALPARYEPFGLGPLEAALAGCALVLGDIPSLREVWDDAASFVDPDDRAWLERALRRLIENDRLRHEMGCRARRRAATFTTDRMATSYLAAYEQAARVQVAA